MSFILEKTRDQRGVCTIERFKPKEKSKEGKDGDQPSKSNLRRSFTQRKRGGGRVEFQSGGPQGRLRRRKEGKTTLGIPRGKTRRHDDGNLTKLLDEGGRPGILKKKKPQHELS